MRPHSKIVFIALGLIFVGSFFYFSLSASRINVAEAESKSESSYPEVGKLVGVWNDGKSALWDLNVIDHFHYFGPKSRAKGYKPEQPINFSHVTHVQKNKMECQYCHWTVTKSPYAAIPEVETCMGCHQQIAGTTDEQKTEIAKIKDHYDKQQPIAWQKVHVMPDYVKFNHKRHIKAGVSCQSCHGQIPEMEVVERATSMKMGWCINCHREQGSSIDCYTCHD